MCIRKGLRTEETIARVRTSSSTKVTFATGGPAPLALAIFLVTRCHSCLCGREGEGRGDYVGMRSVERRHRLNPRAVESRSANAETYNGL